MDYTIKICNNCSGKGIVTITQTQFDHRKGLINGYQYLTWGDLQCKECLGAGIVKYRIIERDEMGSIIENQPKNKIISESLSL